MVKVVKILAELICGEETKKMSDERSLYLCGFESFAITYISFIGEENTMTTLASTSKKCLVCGTVSQFSALQSTNSFGYSDLDFRPAEMKRSTMPYWIQECPCCGYVSSDIVRTKSI